MKVDITYALEITIKVDAPTEQTAHELKAIFQNWFGRESVELKISERELIP
jgi:hypothetical protein